MASFPYLFWLRMGLLSWGGPAAQIALLEQECVEKRRWLTSSDFTRALGLCMFLPGPEAQQLVAWIAWRSHGWRGAAVATLGFVLPGLIACGVLAWLYAVGSGWELLPGVFAGARAAVAGVILVVGVKMLIRTCEAFPRRLAAGLSFGGLFFGAPFVFIALAAGLHGWYVRPDDEEALPPVSDQLRSAVKCLGRYLLPVLLVYLALWLWLKHSHGYVQLVEVSLFAVLTSFGVLTRPWVFGACGRTRWAGLENHGSGMPWSWVKPPRGPYCWPGVLSASWPGSTDCSLPTMVGLALVYSVWSPQRSSRLCLRL